MKILDNTCSPLPRRSSFGLFTAQHHLHSELISVLSSSPLSSHVFGHLRKDVRGRLLLLAPDPDPLSWADSEDLMPPDPVSTSWSSLNIFPQDLSNNPWVFWSVNHQLQTQWYSCKIPQPSLKHPPSVGGWSFFLSELLVFPKAFLSHAISGPTCQ